MHFFRVVETNSAKKCSSLGSSMHSSGARPTPSKVASKTGTKGASLGLSRFSGAEKETKEMFVSSSTFAQPAPVVETATPALVPSVPVVDSVGQQKVVAWAARNSQDLPSLARRTSVASPSLSRSNSASSPQQAAASSSSPSLQRRATSGSSPSLNSVSVTASPSLSRSNSGLSAAPVSSSPSLARRSTVSSSSALPAQVSSPSLARPGSSALSNNRPKEEPPLLPTRDDSITMRHALKALRGDDEQQQQQQEEEQGDKEEKPPVLKPRDDTSTFRKTLAELRSEPGLNASVVVGTPNRVVVQQTVTLPTAPTNPAKKLAFFDYEPDDEKSAKTAPVKTVASFPDEKTKSANTTDKTIVNTAKMRDKAIELLKSGLILELFRFANNNFIFFIFRVCCGINPNVERGFFLFFFIFLYFIFFN
jgi:hypothetical protein